jgi:hypothetical protein
VSSAAKETLMYAAIYGLLPLLFLVALVIRARWEAEAYSRLTGKPVTTWDAMFLDLRVQEPVKE